MAVKPIPDGYNTASPYLVVEGADKLIDFMSNVFGAKERFRMAGPGGAIGHAEMQLGDTVVMLGDSSTTDNNRIQTAMVHVYVDDCDATFNAAIEAGAKVERELQTLFYGDRNGAVRDPFGNVWWISTHIEDVPPDEMEKRSKEFLAQQGQN
jgi:PhnB protein